MHRVSPSAKGVASLRHMELDVSRDTLAKYFCDKEGRRMARKWLELCPYVARTVAIRGRHIEDEAARYIRECGVKQMMNIAAGLNTFPYRHEAASRLDRYVELDLQPMMEFKREVIRNLKDDGVISNPPVTVDYLPIDLSLESFHEDFKKIDWNHRAPTIYLFEGISYYLPLATLAKIMHTFSDVMREGSLLIWDYFPDYVKESLDPLMSTIIDAGGELCLTYLCKADLDRLLRNFSIVSDHLESDLEKKYYPDKISKPVGSIIIAKRL